jgi:hypothetical protein
MRPRVVRDKRSNLDRLRKQLKGLDRKFVVAGLVGMPQTTGLTADQHVVGYGSVQEFGATIKSRTVTTTHYRSIKTNKLVTRKKAMAKPGNHYAKDHQITFRNVRIPARPWLRSWYDTNLTALIKFAEAEILRTILKGQDPDVTLNRIGVFAQAGIRKRIRTARSWAKPLSPVTIKMKGSSAPLIDHGIMINSVSFDIRTR